MEAFVAVHFFTTVSKVDECGIGTKGEFSERWEYFGFGNGGGVVAVFGEGYYEIFNELWDP